MHAAPATLQIVVFALGEIELGIDILQVREIDRPLPVTRVPRVPSYVEGVINLRGQLVPIVDLRARLGMRPKPATKDSRIIVAAIGDRLIGMAVDRVCEVARIPVGEIDANEGILAGLEAEYVSGLARIDNRVIILLAVQNIMQSQAILQSQANLQSQAILQSQPIIAAGSVPASDKERL